VSRVLLLGGISKDRLDVGWMVKVIRVVLCFTTQSQQGIQDFAAPSAIYGLVLPPTMDTAIDLSDASKALDLSNIRFQLM